MGCALIIVKVLHDIWRHFSEMGICPRFGGVILDQTCGSGGKACGSSGSGLEACHYVQRYPSRVEFYLGMLWYPM